MGSPGTGRGIPDEELLDDLRVVAARPGTGALTMQSYARLGGRYHPATFVRRFGAWSTALTRAGLAVVGVVEDGRGIDELTTATINRVRGFGRLAEVDAHWQAADFGFTATPFADLRGGDVPANLAIVEAILAGRGPQGLVDTIVLNTAVALWIVGRISQVPEGIEPARELLLGGAVRAKIAAAREFFHS